MTRAREHAREPRDNLVYELRLTRALTWRLEPGPGGSGCGLELGKQGGHVEMEQGDYASEFPLEWALKDVDLAIASAEGDTLPLLTALSQQWRTAFDAGHGREDISAARLMLNGPD